jgi:hypothetical protein
MRKQGAADTRHLAQAGSCTSNVRQPQQMWCLVNTYPPIIVSGALLLFVLSAVTKVEPVEITDDERFKGKDNGT